MKKSEELGNDCCHQPLCQYNPSRRTVCVWCGEEIFPDNEWYIWVTKEQVDIRNQRYDDFIRWCENAKTNSN